MWCVEEAWFQHSVNFDFRVTDPSGQNWGLPVIIPTCPKKLFAQGPRQKYVDSVTDTLHASSSDLITWNTLVMIKLKWVNLIPRQWLEIATQSLEAWKLRDEKPPFLPDNRRGFARVTPIALSKVGVPNTKIYAMDEFPLHGLGLYDDYESWRKYKDYVWSGWTTKRAQPMHIDPALQAMIDHSVQAAPNAAGQTDAGVNPVVADSTTESKGSQLPVCDFEPPFPTSVPDVCMESSVDKRSRESPDSTLKPEHKSLKTAGVAVATEEEPVVYVTCVTSDKADTQHDIKPQTIRWSVMQKSEVRPIVLRLYHNSPAWRLKTCIDAMKVRPVDLPSLAQATSVNFASDDLVEEAAHCLERIAAELKQDDASQQATSGIVEAPTKDQASSDQPTSSDAATSKSESATETGPLNSQMPLHPKRRRMPVTTVNQSRSSPRSGLTVWLVLVIVFCGLKALLC